MHPRFESLVDYTLANGVRVLLLPETQHDLVTFEVWFGVGARNESPEIYGLSHFIEHLFFKGTKKLGPGEIDKRLSELGAMNNAATSKDYTFYYVSGLAGSFAELFAIQTEMLLNPAFDPEEINKERDVVIAEIHRANDNPGHLFYYQMMEQNFANHPYEHPVLGYENIIRNVSRDEIVSYYEKHYCAANMTVVVAGNFDLEQAKSLIHQSYATLPNKPYQRQAATPTHSRPERRLTYARTNRNFCAHSFLGPDSHNPRDIIALDLLSNILTDRRSSRWSKEFKEDKGLVDQISFSFYTSVEQSLITIYSLVRENRWTDYVKEVEQALDRLRQYYVSREELELAKEDALVQADYRWQKLNSRAQALGYHATLGHLNLCTEYTQAVQKISVEDMIRVIEKYLSYQPVVSQMLPEARREPDTIESAQDAKAHSPSTTVLQKADDVTLFTFASGLRHLHIQQKAHTIGSARILAGSLAELCARFPKGTANLMQNTLSKGSSRQSAEVIAQTMDRLGARYATTQSRLHSRKELVSNFLTAPHRNWDQALTIFCSFFTDAAFSEKEVNKARELIQADIKALPDSLSTFAAYHMFRNWFEGHPFAQSLLGTQQSMQSITNKDLKDLYSLLYNPHNMLIVTSTPQSPAEANEQVHDALNRNMGSLEFRISDQRIPAQFQSPNRNRILVAENSKEQGYIMPVWGTCGMRHKDWVTAQVVAEILGGGMSSRYFRNMRDEKSYGYEIGCRIVGYQDYGLMFAYLGTDPSRIDSASLDFRVEITDLQNHLAPAKEVQKAQQLLLASHAMSLETESDRAGWLANLTMRNMEPDYLKTYPDLVRTVTAEMVREFAQTWLTDPFEQRVLPTVQNN